MSPHGSGLCQGHSPIRSQAGIGDWKLSVDVSLLDAAGLTDYSRLCAGPWPRPMPAAAIGRRSALQLDRPKPWQPPYLNKRWGMRIERNSTVGYSSDESPVGRFPRVLSVAAGQRMEYLPA